MKKFLRAKRKLLNVYVQALEERYFAREHWKAYGDEVWAEFCTEYERIKARAKRMYKSLEAKIPESEIVVERLRGRLERYVGYTPSAKP